MLCWHGMHGPLPARHAQTVLPHGALPVPTLCVMHPPSPCRFGKGKRGLIMGVWNAHTSVGECSSLGQALPQMDATLRAGLMQLAFALHFPTPWE